MGPTQLLAFAALESSLTHSPNDGLEMVNKQHLLDPCPSAEDSETTLFLHQRAFIAPVSHVAKVVDHCSR